MMTTIDTTTSRAAFIPTGKPMEQLAVIQALGMPIYEKVDEVTKLPILTATGAATIATKQDWMRQAGIPEHEWSYVDWLVTRESGWRPTAQGSMTSLGRACGLVQALPCSKLGPNWQDPVHALRWQKTYVNNRYGGYQGAVAWWKTHQWY